MSKQKKLTKEQAIAKLRDRQGDRSLRTFATELGLSAMYLSDVYHGKRGIGPKLLKFLGLKKTVQTTVTYTAN